MSRVIAPGVNSGSVRSFRSAEILLELVVFPSLTNVSTLYSGLTLVATRRL